ncbi:hypothetical protein AMELA_G00057670, partial [Ameiurus melas]
VAVGICVHSATRALVRLTRLHFWFIPNVFSGFEVRVLCRTLMFFNLLPIFTHYVFMELAFCTLETGAHEPGQCCFSYQKKPIPVQHITEYKITNQQCTKPGVILILKDGRHTCANPKDEWVQKIMENIDQRPKARPQPSS